MILLSWFCAFPWMVTKTQSIKPEVQSRYWCFNNVMKGNIFIGKQNFWLLLALLTVAFLFLRPASRVYLTHLEKKRICEVSVNTFTFETKQKGKQIFDAFEGGEKRRKYFRQQSIHLYLRLHSFLWSFGVERTNMHFSTGGAFTASGGPHFVFVFCTSELMMKLQLYFVFVFCTS